MPRSITVPVTPCCCNSAGYTGLGCLRSFDACTSPPIGIRCGVLAIAGAQLGFDPVLAIDVDLDAVEATRQNADANGAAIDVALVDALHDVLPDTDLAVANLTLDTVRALALRLPATRLISSGYLVGDDVVVEGWAHRDRRETDGWAADLWLREAE